MCIVLINLDHATATTVAALNKKKRPPVLTAASIVIQKFSNSFPTQFRPFQLHQPVFIYQGDRIPNKMPFTACRNSKYFKLYGTLNFSQNGLRMPCFFFLSPSNHSSPDFWTTFLSNYNET